MLGMKKNIITLIVNYQIKKYCNEVVRCAMQISLYAKSVYHHSFQLIIDSPCASVIFYIKTCSTLN